ncbi:GDSL esterase/lipase At4g10955-like [Wolffia australiana]
MATWASALRLGRKETVDNGSGEEEEEEEAGIVEIERGSAKRKSNDEKGGAEDHPYDFHVCGPRNLSPPTWKDFFISSWKDPNYKRAAIACLIQGVYLLELDRQRHVSAPPAAAATADLAPRWWRPFNYRLTQALIDARDGSIYAAVLEWDRAAAAAALLLCRPAAAPRVVLALRGTLLSAATLRRDLLDDLRFLACESLRTSARFAAAANAAATAAATHGGTAVCVAGHSLGAAFALQISKSLARDGVHVDCHVFNPPAISLAAAWRRLRDGSAAEPAAVPTWEPHVYVNHGDYISGAAGGKGGAAMGKLFVAAPKMPQRFLEAHALQQWWSNDVELQHVPFASTVEEPKNENKRMKLFNF